MNVRAFSLVCATLVVGACSHDGPSGPTDVTTFRVVRRDLRIALSEKGALKPAKMLSVRPDIPGTAKITYLIDEGTEVKKDDIVCELDRTDKAKEVDDLQNRVIQLQGQLAAAQAELKIQLSQNEADVADAELKREFADVELERFEKGEYVEEMKQREVRVEKAVSEVERTTKRFDQMPELLKEGFVTKEQVEEERIKKVQAESERTLAQLDLDSYVKYSAPKDRKQKQADVRNAVHEIERTKQRAAAREAQKRADVERQNNELGNVTRSLAAGQAVLEKMTIRAPADGIVLYGDANNPWYDKKDVKVGEFVYSGKVIISLPDLSQMQCVVAIHEADIAKIKVGQIAFATPESTGARQIEGEVARIAPVAVPDWMTYDQVRRFNVDITLHGENPMKLKPGVTTRVEILIGECKDVLVVPVQAVFAQNGKFSVFRKSHGAPQRVEVEIDEGNSQFVIVNKGLSENDEVMLMNPGDGDGVGSTDVEDAPKPQAPIPGKP